MKRKLILFSCLALLLGACKKNHDGNTSSSTWTFKGTTYQAAAITYAVGGTMRYGLLTATAAGSNFTFILTFRLFPPPTSSSEMLITDTGDPNTVVVSVMALIASGNTNYISRKTSVKANVTVNNSKVSASFPGNIWLYNDVNSSDSAQLSVGTITQQ